MTATYEWGVAEIAKIGGLTICHIRSGFIIKNVVQVFLRTRSPLFQICRITAADVRSVHQQLSKKHGNGGMLVVPVEHRIVQRHRKILIVRLGGFKVLRRVVGESEEERRQYDVIFVTGTPVCVRNAWSRGLIGLKGGVGSKSEELVGMLAKSLRVSRVP